MMKFKTETFRRLSPSMCISNKLPFNQNLVHMKALSKLSEATVPGLEGCSKHCWPIWCPSPAGWFPRLLDLLDGLPSVLEHQIDRADRADSVTLLTFYWHHQVMECPHILGHGHFLHPAPHHLPPPTTTYHFLPPPTTTTTQSTQPITQTYLHFNRYNWIYLFTDVYCLWAFYRCYCADCSVHSSNKSELEYHRK